MTIEMVVNKYIFTYVFCLDMVYRLYIFQGQRMLFITAQAKLNPEDYLIKCVGG